MGPSPAFRGVPSRWEAVQPLQMVLGWTSLSDWLRDSGNLNRMRRQRPVLVIGTEPGSSRQKRKTPPALDTSASKATAHVLIFPPARRTVQYAGLAPAGPACRLPGQARRRVAAVEFRGLLQCGCVAA